MEEKFLTASKVAKLIDIHRDTLNEWHKNGKFTAHHVNL